MSGDRNVTIKVKQGRGNKIHIFLDGEYAATATLHFWSVYGLKNGDEISEDEWEALKDKIAFEKMYGRALDLLAMRDHSERELSDKLLKKCGFDTKAQVEDVCAELKERGYLDDRRFAAVYAEELIRKKHPAPSGLRAALFAKGIPRDIVNEVMDSVEIDTRSFIILILKHFSIIPWNFQKKSVSLQKKETMPTIFIFFGFRFMFYSNDHEPIHVHVIN